jgi:hypothetical protein
MAHQKGAGPASAATDCEAREIAGAGELDGQVSSRPNVEAQASVRTKKLDGHNPERKVDSRLAFLARATAKFYLVQNGFEDLDQAFADLHHAFHVIAPCPCDRATLDAWEGLDREIRQRQLREWRWRPAATPTWRRS